MVSRRRLGPLLLMAILVVVAGEAPAIVVCPAGPTVQGVDVTRFQGTIDWPQVAASGVEFAFARAADGLSPDTHFAINYAGIRAAGMIRGAYQTLRAGDDALEQAALLLSQIGPLGPGDLPPALEVVLTDGQLPSVVGQAVVEWATAIQEATGRDPFILTGAGFWNDSVSAPDAAQYPLWVAHWNAACPNTPALWLDWDLWQYSGSGSVPGIAGLVDRDVFNGSSSDLQELAGISPAPAMSRATRIVLGLMLAGVGLAAVVLHRSTSARVT